MATKKTADSAEEKALTAFTIASELRAVIDRIIEAGGECSDETLSEMQGWQASLEAKAENIAHVSAKIDGEIAYFQAVEEKAKSHRKAREAAKDRIRKYLAHCMATAGVKSIKQNDGLFSISLVDGRVSPKVFDEGVLPQDLVDVVEVYKPKMQAIKERLEAGVEIPGARLEQGDPYIMIR